MMIQTYIVEDEKPALKRLREMLEELEDIEIIGHSASGKQAVAEIDALKPQLLFLDIHLPDISGIDVLHVCEHTPAIIFTTAYDQYAIEAFELRALDYLLKPFSKERLHEAVERARESITKPAPDASLQQLLAQWQPPAHRLKRIASKIGDRIYVFNDDDVVYFASDNKLVFAHLQNEKHLINYTLDQLETRLDHQKFFRIHRSTIVNLNYVDKIEAWFSGGYKMTVRDKEKTELNISRNAGRALREKLGW